MHPQLGFETVGNATLIAYDGGRPILATDPWIRGPAYFGSWSLSHEIKPEQQQAILEAKYVWISHGHPDHLSGPSLELLKGRQVLLPDHFGGRIAQGLRQDGYNVRILEDRKWTPLSARIRVYCMATDGQDAILLVAFDEHTVLLNTNDTGNSGWLGVIRREARPFRHRILLCASGFGDICGINYYGENGEKILSPCELRKAEGFQVGRANSQLVRSFGATHFVPFSSMHVYQRADSAWANGYVTELDDYAKGYDTGSSTLLPPYLSYDCLRQEWRELKPARLAPALELPEAHGDNWSDALEQDDVRLAERYFRGIEFLPELLDFVRLRVGGKETMIELGARGFHRGITLEAPRGSLMTALKYEVYEDLVLGNFMRIRLHGGCTLRHHSLELITHIARIADNGQAKTRRQLADYRAHYLTRLGRFEFLRYRVEKAIIQGAHRSGLANSSFYRAAKGLYARL